MYIINMVNIIVKEKVLRYKNRRSEGGKEGETENNGSDCQRMIHVGMAVT